MMNTLSKKFCVILSAAIFTMIAVGCASSKSNINFANAPDNEQCNYMRESCAEADRFQSRFDAMDREEREDARAILQGLINKCASMQELCAGTMNQ